MTYQLKGNYSSGVKSYSAAVIRVSNIHLGPVDGTYGFTVGIYESETAAEPVEVATNMFFEIPNDTSEDALEIRAIKMAATVFMPEGEMSVIDIS
ncbi:TPA: hypothetical protein ACUB6Y_001978 [Raoultella ornithinolytica]